MVSMRASSPVVVMTLLLLLPAWAEAACPDTIPEAGTLECGDEVTATLDHEAGSIFGQDCDEGLCYGCGAAVQPNQLGPEAVWTLVCPSAGGAVLRLTELDCDIDIYVLTESCDPDADCVGASEASSSADDEVEFDCVVGETFQVLIEAFGVGSPELTGACSEDDALYSPTYTLQFDADLSEVCNETCDDGIDNDGDGLIDCDDPYCADTAACCDLDADGFYGEPCGGDDCDDEDADVYPGAPEVWDNGLDEDCDGVDAQAGELDVPDYQASDVCYGCSCTCGCEGGGSSSAQLAWLALFCLPARRPRRRLGGPRGRGGRR